MCSRKAQGLVPGDIDQSMQVCVCVYQHACLKAQDTRPKKQERDHDQAYQDTD